MVNKCIDIIFYNTVSIIIEVLGKKKIYVEAYKNYVKNRYEDVLNEFIKQDKEDMVKFAVELYIDSEKRYWSGFNKEGMLSILEEDKAYEHVRFLSEVAYSQVIKCVSTNTFLDNDKEYEKQLEQLDTCLKDVKYFNENKAKALVSEAILDIKYAYNKTKNMSLRLGRYM